MHFYISSNKIALNSAAYVSEIVRAGIEAVDKGQMEAARYVEPTTTFPANINSLTPIIDAIEDSLIIATNSFPIAGNIFLTA